MTSFSTDCLTHATIQPNSSVLTGIKACQAAANTTYCYPPNGTRICVPAEEIPFYWPTTYYSRSSIIAISWEPTSDHVLAQANTGNRTEDISPYIFDSHASPLPDTPNEKALEWYFRERRTNDETNPSNLATHNGPTLILVKTAEWPSSTRLASGGLTSTGRRDEDSDDEGEDEDDDEDDDGDDGLGVHSGVIAGIVVGAVLGVMALVLLCWKGCCCCRGKRRDRGKTVDGVELVVQSGGGGNGGGRIEERDVESGMGRKEVFAKVGPVEESVAGPSIRLDEPPPRYTP